MIGLKPLASLSPDELLTLVLEQRQIAELTTLIEALRAEIARLKRGDKRQPPPFAKAMRIAQPKPPGRKQGSGTFRQRRPPWPDQITDPPVDVKVTLEACPVCEG